MLALIKNMEFDFDWNGVTIYRIKNETVDCYYFVDKFGKKVLVRCQQFTGSNQALSELKRMITYYITNHWVKNNLKS